jgi:hypothetical protein
MSKNKKKHKRSQSKTPPKISPEKYIIEQGRKLPIYKCLINEIWQSAGMATIWIIRKRPNGLLIFGNYLVDLTCLGLKDTFYRFDFEEEELNDTLEILQETGQELVDCDFGLAQNIIYGAIEFAEEIGFKPHKDFKITQYILEDIEEVDFMEIEFGVNGKPRYSAGPEDNVKLILNTLNRTVGEGNYDYLTDRSPFLNNLDFDLRDDEDFVEDDDEENDDIDNIKEEGFTEFEEIK